MKKEATRKSFGNALAELGEKYQNVVCLDADLAKSTQSQIFAKKYPNRFFEMGIQEANMIGCAAGLSFAGKIPFLCSFAAFVTGRFDQIRMSISYSEANVKIVGTHCGVGIGEDGHSQMGLEDIALMRTLPNMTVLQPMDAKETFEMIEWSIQHNGPVYLRLTRQGLKQYNHKDSFVVGKHPQIRSGEKVAFLANGGLLEMTENAAQIISDKSSISPSVYNSSTAKPLDKTYMNNLLKSYDKLVVFEDHNVIGGTGTSVIEWMMENSENLVKIHRYGVQDQFGESGSPAGLYEKHGFTAEKIVQRLEKEGILPL